ncbi:MAG: tRNA (adenosine(37)-N6)-dimethylallyltransferase MiaA [Candidatus Taylorbacteria bacterium]|nr:tRNA (adenosine(37)-N6)-dimethylallyltransferase MiaA [Candidatus Taylorbacteria bacterium]
MSTKPKIIVVLGPTATGKSDVAVQLAKTFNGEIISADSRQVYRGMDLGSGKITKKEMSGIPHYLLDIVKPQTYFSVAKYKKFADKAIEEIIKKNKTPIICGGTGFYIDSIVKNITFPEVLPNQKLRKELGKKSVEKLFHMLKKLDPKRASAIDKNNPVRLIRAIEIAKEIGFVPEIKELPQKYDFIFIGLDLPDQVLKERISIRLINRIEAGMIKEIENLHNAGVSWKRLESFGLEYRQTALFLQNIIGLEKMKENLNREIWNFVKRQRTWFKTNKEIVWINPLKKSDIIEANKLTKRFIYEK